MDAVEIPIRTFYGADGAELGYREIGDGRPLVLLHGYFSNAVINWLRPGHAALIAARGHRVIMPDLRGHGVSFQSDAPPYPLDVLVDDGFALVDQLGLIDYDLGGYSLGGRTAARMLVRGAAPRSAILGGTGITGITDALGSARYFRYVLENLGHHERGSASWMAEAFLKTTHNDPAAMINVLETFVDTPIELLTQIRVPTLVVVGEDDDGQESAADLAAAIPFSTFLTIPGNHMSAVSKPPLGLSIAEFI